MKKISKIIWEFFAFFATTTFVVTPVVSCSMFNNISIDSSKLYNYFKTNINNTNQLSELFSSSDELINIFLENNIINETTANSINFIKLSLSTNNQQVHSNFLKINIEFQFNQKYNYSMKEYKNIDTNINIIHFNENKFRDSFKQISINELPKFLSNENIINNFVNLNVGLSPNSLLKIDINNPKNYMNNNIFYSTPCTYKLNFNIKLSTNYVFNTNNTEDGEPNFQDYINVTNVLSEPIVVQVNWNNLKEQISNFNNFSSIHALQTQDNLDNFIKEAKIVDEFDWIETNEIKYYKNQNNKLDIEITTTLIDGNVYSSGPISTLINIVNFDNITFNNSILKITSSNQLNDNELINTIINTNSGITFENIDINKTYSSINNTIYNDSNDEVYIYDFNIGLQESYCFFNSLNNTPSNNITINNVQTSIPKNINININILEKLIKNNTNTLDQINDLFNPSNNYQNLLEKLKYSGCVSNPNYILSINVENSTVTTDKYANFLLNIKLNSEPTPNIINIKVNTNVQLVNINENKLRMYIEENVDTNDQWNNLINILINSQSGFTTDNLSIKTSSIPTNPNYYNDELNIPYLSFDLNLQINDGYCFLDSNSQTLALSKIIKNVYTGIRFDYKTTINDKPFIQYINNNYNTLNSANNLINMPIVDLIKIINDNNYVADPNWIKSANVNYESNNGLLKYNFIIIFTDDTYQYFSIQTNIALYS